MSESYVEVREDGTVRLAGELAYPQATVADVLTVQADGSIAAAAASGGGGAVLAVTTPLSSADILALHTTPIELAPAVADSFLLPLWIVGVLTPGGNAYTANGDLRIFNGATWAAADDGVNALETSWLTTSAHKIRNIVKQGATDSLTTSLIGAGSGLTLGNTIGARLAVDASDAFADGDGTATLTTYYVVVPTP